MRKYKFDFCPVIFPTDYDTTGIVFQEREFKAEDHGLWVTLMSQFGLANTERGSEERVVEVDGDESPMLAFRRKMLQELEDLARPYLGTDRPAGKSLALVVEESIPIRNGWFIFGGGDTGMLYVGVADDGGGGEEILRTRSTAPPKDGSHPIALLYGFLVTHFTEVG